VGERERERERGEREEREKGREGEKPGEREREKNRKREREGDGFNLLESPSPPFRPATDQRPGFSCLQMRDLKAQIVREDSSSSQGQLHAAELHSPQKKRPGSGARFTNV
jgi:hypothetical protein